MFHVLLAGAARTRPASSESGKLDQIYNAVVTNMPWGGLGLMMILIALTLIVGLYALWSQRRLASNQVRIARMLEQHMAEHEKRPAAGQD